MKLACMMEFPPEILTRAKELIPILSAKLKVTHKFLSCHVKNEELNKKKKRWMMITLVYSRWM
jgi:hypothetical protein